MKLGGRKLSNNNLEIVVIPRNDGDLVFKFRPVLSTESFDKLVKLPDIPIITDAQGTRSLPDDPEYRKNVLAYINLKSQWMFLDSISATEGLEWETVDIGNSKTWALYTDELREAGLTEIEAQMLSRAFEKVNSLNESHLEEARNRFLASLQGSQGQ